ncbi:MAG: hypothetical protein PHP04_05345 [Bacteroidales bacterium]|nr:hypothetical protein [Bacteroidales bacterium]
MSKEFIKEIEKGLSTICNKIGFKKKQYYFIKSFNDNVIATLNFGIVSHKVKGHIFVDVGVGVAYNDIEKLYTELTNIDKSIFKHTISEQLGYLMPHKNYKEWDFVENADNSNTFEDLLNCIQTYGFEYFERMKDFNNLFEAFETRTPGLLNQARDRYLPILYSMKGEKRKGIQFIEEAVERQKKPVDDGKKEFLKKLAGSGGQVIIGNGVGKVDPEYLKFAENYKAMPST